MQFNRRLTGAEMESLKSVAGDPVATIVKFYDIALAPSSFDEQEAIQPTNFKIPESQWGQVVSWLREGQPDADSAFVACWHWMNSGPSSSQEEEA